MDGKQNKLAITVRDITLIALLSVVLFVQEEALTLIPGLQFTVFLLVFYSKKLGLWRTSIIVLIHVFLDNLVIGSFSIIYTPFMFVGWIVIPLTICTVFKKIESSWLLAILGAIYSFVYCWVYFIPDCLIIGIQFIPRFMSDIFWEILMAAMSFLSLLFLYRPLSKVLDPLIKRQIKRPCELDKMSRETDENNN